VNKRWSVQTPPRHFPRVHQKASASPPYRFGNSRASITGNNAFCIAWWLVPTTAIFDKVLAEMSGLKTQKIQLRSVGTLTKNFLCYN
jgi:hypothetical protein